MIRSMTAVYMCIGARKTKQAVGSLAFMMEGLLSDGLNIRSSDINELDGADVFSRFELDSAKRSISTILRASREADFEHPEVIHLCYQRRFHAGAHKELKSFLVEEWKKGMLRSAREAQGKYMEFTSQGISCMWVYPVESLLTTHMRLAGNSEAYRGISHAQFSS